MEEEQRPCNNININNRIKIKNSRLTYIITYMSFYKPYNICMVYKNRIYQGDETDKIVH